MLKEIEEHFIGLWTYQKYNNTSRKFAKTRSYCVTVCAKGNHVDTHAHKNPMNAFKEAIEIIEQLDG